MLTIQPSTTRCVQIHHALWDEHWVLQFPESIGAREGWAMDYQPFAVDWRRVGDDAWTYDWRTDESYLQLQEQYKKADASGHLAGKHFAAGLALRAEITAAPHALVLTLTLSNESDRVFTDVFCDGGCFQASQAGGFAGPGEIHRSHLMCGGSMVSMGTLDRTVAERCTYCCRPKDYDAPHIREGEWFWGRSPARPDSPLIVGMVAKDGRRAVTLGYEGSFSGSANADEHHHCLHSRPSFGDLAPGASVTRRGYILFGEAIQSLGQKLGDLLNSNEWK